MSAALDEVRRAVDQTTGSRSARISCTTTFTWTMSHASSRKRGPIRQVAVTAARRVATAVGRPILRLVAGRDDLRRFTSEGFIDFAGDRSLVDHGSFAILQAGTQVWSGRSGRPIATLDAEPARVASPLWLVHLLAGTVSASEQGSDRVDGEQWRRFDVVADLAIASAARPGGMPSPAQDRFETLRELSFEVWLHDGYLKQIRFVTAAEETVITLTEFGVDVDGLDWQTLPVFNS